MTQKPAHPVAIVGLDAKGRRGVDYPKPFDEGFEHRVKRPLGDIFDLTQFGVNLVTLEPGAMSSQRHWHVHEDEFVYVLEGTITLGTDAGETELTPGMAAGFPAGEANGHHLVNKSSEPALYLEIGTRSPTEDVTYPDVDMLAHKVDGKYRITHKDGTPYDE